LLSAARPIEIMNGRIELSCLPLTAARAEGAFLGGAVYGDFDFGRSLSDCVGAEAAAACARVDMQPLLGGDFAELWRVLGSGALTSGRAGRVHWCASDSLMYAHLAIDEASVRRGAGCALEPAAYEAYRELFALLDDSGYPHPVRFWNYLPRINVDEDGLERYRHFNVGRHAAFVEARRPPDASPPAACALGCDGQSLLVMVLAARRPAQAIENPRQVSAYRYPTQYGPRPPAFSRAAIHREGRDLLLVISGTASIVGHKTLHIGDVESQVDESLRNVEAVIDAANQAVGGKPFALDRLQLKGYVRRSADAPAVARRLNERLGGQPVPLVRADICRANLLFEIEGAGTAWADAAA
jgi:enamine deaminase RidA (YjgF/YER057c/UK114 family)